MQKGCTPHFIQELATMALKLKPKGHRIKALREASETEYRQKTLAAKIPISERALRRIENEDKVTKAEVLRRIAGALNTTLEDIAYGSSGPRLVIENGKAVRGVSKKTQGAGPDFTDIPRFSTAYLYPVKGAQHLFDEIGHAQEIAPHILIDAEPELFALIEELLTLLKGVMLREWSALGPALSDDFDDEEFPNVSRMRRMSEILVLLKGNDIRVAVGTHTKHYQDGETPWLEGQKWFTQLLIAFVPAGEYFEDTVEVPVDHGKDIRLPMEPIF
jgi:DNA-binding XRE family transcriptional regulator